MKIASRSGFLVFLGGILAARNVVHVRAAFTLQPPPHENSIDIVPSGDINIMDMIPSMDTTVYDTGLTVSLSPFEYCGVSGGNMWSR
jgi:hypothetical protein